MPRFTGIEKCVRPASTLSWTVRAERVPWLSTQFSVLSSQYSVLSTRSTPRVPEEWRRERRGLRGATLPDDSTVLSFSTQFSVLSSQCAVDGHGRWCPPLMLPPMRRYTRYVAAGVVLAAQVSETRWPVVCGMTARA